MESADVRTVFADRGVVRLRGAFSPEAAARIHAVAWRHAERTIGVRPDDRSSWPTNGWLPISWKRIKRQRVFDVMVDNALVPPALDAIFGAGRWQRPKRGPQVLFSMPGPEPWSLPVGWHMDCGFEEPTWPASAVKLFAFVGDVAPFGGGTLLLRGSHHLVDRYRRSCDLPPGPGKQHWQRFLRRHPPLDELLSAADRPDLGRSMVGQCYDVDGVAIDVLELTGSPGDVVITHVHVFHAGAPNTGHTPREMLGMAITAC